MVCGKVPCAIQLSVERVYPASEQNLGSGRHKLACGAGGAAAKLAAKDATFKEVMILAAPMFFDLTATVLMSIGLL